MVFCSSEAGSFGNIGQTDYAAANSFMDAFAERRKNLKESGLRYGKTLSVNWPYWKEGGMRASAEIEKAMFDATGEVPLETSTGVEALGLMLGCRRIAWSLFKAIWRRSNLCMEFCHLHPLSL